MTAHRASPLLPLVAILWASGLAVCFAAEGNNPSGNSTPVPTSRNNMFSNPINQPIPPATSPYVRYGVLPYPRGSRPVPTQRR